MQQSDLVIAVFEFVLLIFSLCVHECSHAWMASRLGDQTARMEGRITLNPMYHMDPIGTLLFPALMIFGPLFGLSFFGGMLVGWAKPTPVNTRNFRRIVRDDNLTTLAGPASNLLLALVGVLVLAFIAIAIPGGRPLVRYTFGGTLVPAILLANLAILVNLSLCIFNLFPIPPLDGSHIVRNMLPYNAVQVYDRIPIWVSYLLMIFLGPYVLMALLGPAVGLIYIVLSHV